MVRAKKRSSNAARITTQLFIKPKSVKAAPAPEPPAFDTLPVSKKQCKQAVDALVAHAKKRVAEKQNSDLLADEDNEAIWLGVTLKRMSPKDNHKPIRIALPHPLLDPRNNPVCLLVKDPQREYKDLLDEKKIKFISRVVGLEKLQGKFKPFEARRQLMKENDLFLVDDRIMPEMPRVLGKQWLQAKKSPIPVTLKRVDLKGELERAISSTYLRINKGTSLAIKIGSLSAHSPQQLLENLIATIPYLAVRLPMGGWDNVQSLHIKTTTSTSLPIWSCSLDENDEADAKSRFFVSNVDEAEVEAKKKAKAEKDERIREKRLRKLESEARKIALENKEAEVSTSDAEEEEDDAADAAEETTEVAEEDLEEIDESVKSKSVDKAKDKKPKQLKATSSPAKAERKKISSTSKKMKGLDSVKGLPRKAKKA